MVDSATELSPSDLSIRVKDAARSSGFGLVGIAPVGPATHGEFFREWLSAGRDKPLSHIFAPELDARLDPRVRYPWAKSVVSLGVLYDHNGAAEPDKAARAELSRLTFRPHLPAKPGCDDLDPEGWRKRDPKVERRSREMVQRSPALGVWPWIGRYERDANYHRINDGNLERFVSRLPAAAKRPVRVQEVVEHGSFFERDLAYQAGLGWVGKNNLIISPKLGSFFVLTSVFVDLDLAPDEVVTDHCGSCTMCIDACPTGALDGPRNMIIERCLTTRSVDIGGVVEPQFLKHLPGHLSGCDICQNVCPFNENFRETSGRIGAPPDRWAAVTIMDLMGCDESERLVLLSGSLLARISIDTLQRNAILAGARILRVAAGEPRAEDLDLIAVHVHPTDLCVLVDAIQRQADSPYESVRGAAEYALRWADRVTCVAS